MSERELNRIEVLSRVEDGTMTATNAANLLNLSRRQIQRLVKRLAIEGGPGLAHKARGLPSNNQTHPHRRAFIMDIVRDIYSDFGPTLTAEMLAQRHSIKLSAETVRKCPLAHVNMRCRVTDA